MSDYWEKMRNLFFSNAILWYFEEFFKTSFSMNQKHQFKQLSPEKSFRHRHHHHSNSINQFTIPSFHTISSYIVYSYVWPWKEKIILLSFGSLVETSKSSYNIVRLGLYTGSTMNSSIIFYFFLRCSNISFCRVTI